ncbi:methyltransferase domain-containing protein [Streptomyces sp. NPDC047315]|uniref:class I SAM-dependent methyltransferase n=1 Tax=Streptomyces sp. NPDC047315 TaxID=3155142 RepID=UPI0033EC8E11
MKENPQGKIEASPFDVGQLYDRNSAVVDAAAAGNVHFGYWHDETDPSSLEEATDRLTDLVVERLAPGPGQRLLDVGCGTGKPAVHVASRGARVTGVSISHREVALARARVAAAGRSDLFDRVDFQVADAMALPFPDASFDGVWAVESLTHMSDRAAALSEAFRTLRPGGRIVICDFLLRAPVTGEKAESVRRMCELFRAPSLAGPEEYRAAIADAGLVLSEFQDIGEHVRPTYLALAEALAAVEAPAEEAAAVEFLASVDLLPRIAALPEAGYVLAVARRPKK